MDLYSIIWDGIEIYEIEIFSDYDTALSKLDFYKKISCEFKILDYRIIKLKFDKKLNIYSFCQSYNTI